MSDLINRQALLDKVSERQRKLIYCFGFENDMVKIMDIAKSIITAIPSAQPEIIRCKDCKHYKWEATRCLTFNAPMREDGFCSHGKRRTDEEVEH